MQKNYVQEILSIIHSGLPKAELAEKLSGGCVGGADSR